ncbi:MAG: DUF6057 family protein [Tannerellaceae bacterium]|jgi:hypothetical protein|nr:DUF6057 family protein [Tannerellaceae bacterium]
MNKQIQYTGLALNMLFGLCVFLFLGYFYRYHLVYQEQFQMFLFTSDYLAETTHKPGGFADYAGRFFTQFYYIPWLGALFIALLLMLIQRQLLKIADNFGKKPAFMPLTFIPSLFYWILLCEEHYMLAGVISLVMALMAMQVYMQIDSKRLRIVYALLMLPMLYWLAGGTYVVFAILCILLEINAKEITRMDILLYTIGCLVLIIALPLLARGIWGQYPLSKLWSGANYYRYQTIFPSTILLLWGTVILVPVLFRYLPSFTRPGTKWIWTGALIMALGFLTNKGIIRMADWQKEEIMTYDYYIRKQQWDEVIRMANQKTPMSPLSVSFLNLALCKQGLMSDQMFRYFQNGPEGLMPSFVRDFTMPMMAGEVYYHLGFVNTAQRFAFEAMEAIPDFQKSSRAVKRLAETNLVNGEYVVAGKYLRMLQHTLYYRDWANKTWTVLRDEKKIEANPEWSHLRRYRTQTDFLFSEQEKEQMLGVLLQQDFTNRMAYEYLMAYCLLTKDLQHFFSYYPLGKEIAGQQIPLSYQEALIYIWGLSNNDPTTIPYPVSADVKRRVQEYGRVYTNYQNSEPMLKNQFSDTYWYYLHFRK